MQGTTHLIVFICYVIPNTAVSESLQADQNHPVASAFPAHRSHQLPRLELLYTAANCAGSQPFLSIERGPLDRVANALNGS